MKFEQMERLIEAVSSSTLTEFKYEEDGVKLSLKKEEKKVIVNTQPAVETVASGAPVTQQNVAQSNGSAQSANGTAAGMAAENNAEVEMAGNVVTSPLVGTFYTAPSEDAEDFVKVGDKVEAGQVLAIIEAMKLMNEIETDFTGTVTEILVENGEAVEYGQPLFRIA
ncbi:MAG: acetyl-CoA carboxylase biotin carboxyl carrier protein [Hespellia sp.]|nr:acetyl-CoA carboxylase biotin carboxyl carrier protein [Hespellia sp.]